MIRSAWLIGPMVFLCHSLCAEGARISDDQPLTLPEPASYQLRVLTPSLLELTLITTKKTDTSKIEQWDFLGKDGAAKLPAQTEFAVSIGSKTIPVQQIGFKRRVLYAPFKRRDLRIANWLYLRLAEPIPENQTVEVKNPSKKLWPPNLQFVATNSPQRLSPAVHVNQVGYLASRPKKAMIGYYLGSLGEMEISGENRNDQTSNVANPVLTF